VNKCALGKVGSQSKLQIVSRVVVDMQQSINPCLPIAHDGAGILHCDKQVTLLYGEEYNGLAPVFCPAGDSCPGRAIWSQVAHLSRGNC
jgi:hypothetical protein